MGKLFGGGGGASAAPPPMPDVPAPPPALQSPQGAEAADAAKRRAAQAFGTTAAIRTSGKGLQTPATTAQKTLLGG
jgi:hypothetical protein